MNFRIDRLITLYAVTPLRSFVSAALRCVPILMYHSISKEDESGIHSYYRTVTSPQIFSEHLRYLHANGFRTCSLDEAIDHLQQKCHDTTKRVVITFDDAYADFYRRAFPLIDQFGFSATVFLPTGYIGDRPMQFKYRDCLTWSEVRELQRHGVVFGSHTVSHPQLWELSAKAVEEEVVRSKRTIEDKTGCAVTSFAYPFAFPQTDAGFIRRLRESLLRARYRNGVCTIVGRANRNSDRLFMERLPMNSRDDRRLFAAKLAGAYDWMRTAQYLKKSWGNRTTKLRGDLEEELPLSRSAQCKC
jgi:peptidoglycan/xylan/chitin deacetylase (PgdA/CDA1 family)